jgi:hypothetical protein
VAAIVSTVVVSTVVVSTAAQEVNDEKNFDIGATVTLQGCVIRGERDGTFVFSRVTVWPVADSPNGRYGPYHFWLENAASRLADHVGETIQVTGIIANLTESEVEREPGGWHGGFRVAIELPSSDVLTSPGNAGIPSGQLGNHEDMKITLLKVRIESLLTVMKTCLPRMR